LDIWPGRGVSYAPTRLILINLSQYLTVTVRIPRLRHPSAFGANPQRTTVDQGGNTVKFRIYKLAFAVASIAALIEVLGAGRRF
jgi:hypothetical protein